MTGGACWGGAVHHPRPSWSPASSVCHSTTDEQVSQGCLAPTFLFTENTVLRAPKGEPVPLAEGFLHPPPAAAPGMGAVVTQSSK